MWLLLRAAQIPYIKGRVYPAVLMREKNFIPKEFTLCWNLNCQF